MNSKFKSEIVGIYGSDLLAQSWAMTFASAGYQVVLYNAQGENVARALESIQLQLKHLEKDGLLRGELNSEENFQCISGSSDLKVAFRGAILIQECEINGTEIKKKVFQELDDIVDVGTILSSSTGTIRTSVISEGLKHKTQVIVSHPIDPPYFIPLVEIMPAPWTSPEIVAKTRDVMTSSGQTPVLLSREIDGLVSNRIQFSIFNEIWRLIEAKIIDVQDSEKVMSEGLGLRYAFYGALESNHLNAEGMKSSIERYGEVIYRVSQSMGEVSRITQSPITNEICEELNKMVPLDRLKERRAWRDECLACLALLKKEMNETYKK